MEDVEKMAESVRDNPEQYDTLRFLFGLYPNEGISETLILNDEEAKIDKFICPLISKLNDIGYKALASCSGLISEHQGAKFHKGTPSGYLSILRTEETIKMVNELPDTPNIEIDFDGEAYLQPSITFRIKAVSDEKLKATWIALGKGLEAAYVMLKGDDSL